MGSQLLLVTLRYEYCIRYWKLCSHSGYSSVMLVQTAINAITQMVSSLSALPTLYSLCASLAGITHRCAQLLEALDELRVRLYLFSILLYHLHHDASVDPHCRLLLNTVMLS